MFGKKEPTDVAMRVVTRSGLVVDGTYRSKEPTLRHSWGVTIHGNDTVNGRVLLEATSRDAAGGAPETSPAVWVQFEQVLVAMVLDPVVAAATAEDYAKVIGDAYPVLVRCGAVDVAGRLLAISDPFPTDGDNPMLSQYLYPVLDATVQARGQGEPAPAPLVFVHPGALEVVHRR